MRSPTLLTPICSEDRDAVEDESARRRQAMMRPIKNAAILALTIVLTIAAFAAVVVYAPRCKPGDPGIYIGGMLVGGCPRTDAAGRG